MMNTGGSGVSLPPFFDLSAFSTIGSTNEEARRLADLGRGEGQLVWSLKQTHGVGRRGRQWNSPSGNLYCSLLLRPNCDAAEGAKLSFLVAVAMYDTLQQILPETTPLALKWPNDVLISGKKVAGILLESKSNPKNQLEWLIVGTGVNVASFPAVTDGLAATSITQAGGDAKLEVLLYSYATNFLALYQLWQSQGFSSIREKWLARASGVGSEVTVKLANNKFAGTFTDMDETGALVLTMRDGSTKLVTAGEVFFQDT
ncbi:MAG: biotin--[acetyl-CoA-carboxylase] ligase [Sneathiella sp.]